MKTILLDNYALQRASIAASLSNGHLELIEETPYVNIVEVDDKAFAEIQKQEVPHTFVSKAVERSSKKSSEKKEVKKKT